MPDSSRANLESELCLHCVEASGRTYTVRDAGTENTANGGEIPPCRSIMDFGNGALKNFFIGSTGRIEAGSVIALNSFKRCGGWAR